MSVCHESSIYLTEAKCVGGENPKWPLNSKFRHLTDDHILL